MFNSLKKPLLFKEVEEQIKKSINIGLFKPKQKLPSERELVEQFQVSRATIREALKDLQNMGMIHVKRGIHAGAYIAEQTSFPITQSFENLLQAHKVDLSHLMQARLYIEPSVAAHAALYRTQNDIDNLNKLLDTAEGLLDTSVREARLTNILFHVEISRITRNPIIIFLSESITHVCSSIIIEMTKEEVPKRTIKKFINEHRKILKSIADRDAKGSFTMSQKHLYDTYRMYLKVIPTLCHPGVMRQIHKFIGS
jgi:GntR family transcriptional repressor for pyruvate dehydrogenase complex